MEFIKLLDTAELAAGSMTTRVIGGKEILIANLGGKYYAMNNKCTHQGGSLAKGKLEGTVVTCPRHGAMFDVTTGKPCGNARIAFLSIKVQPEECYPVKVEGTSILVSPD